MYWKKSLLNLLHLNVFSTGSLNVDDFLSDCCLPFSELYLTCPFCNISNMQRVGKHSSCVVVNLRGEILIQSLFEGKYLIVNLLI